MIRYIAIFALRSLPLAAAVNYTYGPSGSLAKVDYGNGATIYLHL
jgi:hypothetical protein